MPNEFTRLPDGSLIMTGAKAPKPGMLAGLRNWISERFQPRQPAQQPYWIPPQQAPAQPAQAPVSAVVAPPAYNAWSEIEGQAAKEEAIVKALGDAPRRILNSKQLVEGKWF